MKLITRTSNRQGPVIIDTYNKQVTRNYGDRKVVKTVNSQTDTDLYNKTSQSSGTKTKQVYKGGQLTKTKVTALKSPRY